MFTNHAAENIEKCVEFSECSLFAGSEAYTIGLTVTLLVLAIVLRKYDVWS